MKYRILVLLLLIPAAVVVGQKQKARTTAEIYYPTNAAWAQKSAAEAGMDAAKLQEAISFSISHETKNPRDMAQSHYQTFGKEPFGYGIGPFKERGDVTGMVIRHGYRIAEWGDPDRVDMTHSVTKSFLSTVIGLAVDRGMIASVNDTVWKYVPPILAYDPIPDMNKSNQLSHSQFITPFESKHNRKITWDHLLRQVSDWE